MVKGGCGRCLNMFLKRHGSRSGFVYLDTYLDTFPAGNLGSMDVKMIRTATVAPVPRCGEPTCYVSRRVVTLSWFGPADKFSSGLSPTIQIQVLQAMIYYTESHNISSWWLAI